MASRARTKRLAREVPELRKKNSSYFVNIDDQNLTSFHAYIMGPDDSCYAGKLVKLKIEVPVEYPYKPPKCTFVQQRGGRIHPNLYNEGGKVCLSILGTWEGPGWAFTMTIDTVLITIQSLLDAKPLLHEPHRQNSEAYNDYVRYTTWRWLFLDYIDAETDVSSKIFLRSYLKEQGPRIWEQLQKDKNAMRNANSVTSSYSPRTAEPVDWLTLENDVRSAITKAGGSISGLAAVGEVLSPGQLVSDSSAIVNTVDKATVLVMQPAREKRTLDVPESSSMRQDLAKKPATNTKHLCATHMPIPPPSTKARPSQQRTHEVIDLCDDEEPTQSSFSSRKTSKESESAGSPSHTRRTGVKTPLNNGKPKEVIVIDDD